MKGLLRKDLYLMIKYCRLFFIMIIVFSFAGAWYSGNLFVGLLAGMLGGLVVSLLHGLLSITLVQNHSVICIISYYNFQHYPGKPAFLR